MNKKEKISIIVSLLNISLLLLIFFNLINLTVLSFYLCVLFFLIGYLINDFLRGEEE